MWNWRHNKACLLAKYIILQYYFHIVSSTSFSIILVLQDLVNGYTCDCNLGWTGVTCDTDIDECQTDPCVNGNCTVRIYVKQSRLTYIDIVTLHVDLFPIELPWLLHVHLWCRVDREELHHQHRRLPRRHLQEWRNLHGKYSTCCLEACKKNCLVLPTLCSKIHISHGELCTKEY